MCFSIISQTLKFYILCSTLTQFQLYLPDFAHLGRKIIITPDYFDTTNPTFSPYLPPTLCSSHSVDLQQPRMVSPRYLYTLGLCCCPAPCGRRVFNTQAPSLSPFVLEDVILRALQVWASRACEDDVHPGTKIFLVRKILMSGPGSDDVLETAL